MTPDLWEILHGCPHFSPGLVEELDTDAEKLLKRFVMAEEHRVIGRLLLLG